MLRFLNFFILLFILCLFGGCMATTGGKKVEESFSDPQVQALVKAACLGETGKIESLIKAGVDVNTSGKDGVSPLFWVVGWCEEGNKLKGVKALLAQGADPNQAKKTGYTPLLVVSTYKDSRFLRAMLDYGGNPDARTKGIDSALSNALSLGAHRDLWENYYMLLDAGADININYNLPTNPGTIAGIAAGVYGRYDKALELVKRGLDRKYYFSLLGTLTIGEISGSDASEVVPARNELKSYLLARLTDEEKRAYEESRARQIEHQRKILDGTYEKERQQRYEDSVLKQYREKQKKQQSP